MTCAVLATSVSDGKSYGYRPLTLNETGPILLSRPALVSPCLMAVGVAMVVGSRVLLVSESDGNSVTMTLSVEATLNGMSSPRVKKSL